MSNDTIIVQDAVEEIGVQDVTDIIEVIGVEQPGPAGINGDRGYAAWTPELRTATRGDDVVLQVYDYVGGQGTKPQTGLYLGTSGLVSSIDNASNFKGAAGTSISITGTLDDQSDLPPTGTAGEGYLIDGDLWVWSANTHSWVDVGSIRGPAGPASPNAAEQLADAGLALGAPTIPALKTYLEALAKNDVSNVLASVWAAKQYKITYETIARSAEEREGALWRIDVRAMGAGSAPGLGGTSGDGAIINAAIILARTFSPPKTVYFPPGDYLLDEQPAGHVSSIYVRNGILRMVGAGHGQTTLIVPPGGNRHIAVFEDLDRLKIKGITFVGDKYGTTGNPATRGQGVFAKSCDNITFDDVEVIDAFANAFLTDADCNRIEVLDCRAIRPGLHYPDETDNRHGDGFAFSGGDAGTHAEYIYIRNFYCEDSNGSSINLSSVDKVIIEAPWTVHNDDRPQLSGHAAIRLTNDVYNVTISDLYAKNCGLGLFIDDADSLLIIGGNIDGALYNGARIQCKRSTDGRIIILGLRIRNPAQLAIPGTSAGLKLIDVHNASIVGVRVSDALGNMEYGIQEQGDCQNNTFTDEFSEGAKIANYALSPTARSARAVLDFITPTVNGLQFRGALGEYGAPPTSQPIVPGLLDASTGDTAMRAYVNELVTALAANGRIGIAPTWTVNYTTGQGSAGGNIVDISSIVTLARASIKHGFGLSSELLTFANDTRAIVYRGGVKGASFEGDSVNHVRNPSGYGGVAGSPGTPPANFTITAPPTGMTRTLSFGSDAYGAYFGVAYSGVNMSGAEFDATISPEVYSHVPAVAGDVWCASGRTRLVSGSMDGTVNRNIRCVARTAGGAGTSVIGKGGFLPGTDMALSSAQAVMPAGTGSVTMDYRIGVPAYVAPDSDGQGGVSGAANFEIRFYYSQLERRPFPTSPMLPAVPSVPADTSRAADYETFDATGMFGGTPTYGQVTFQAANLATANEIDRCILSVGATANDNIWLGRRASDGQIHLTIVAGGVQQCDLLAGTILSNTDGTVAFQIGANYASISLRGGAVVTHTGITIPASTAGKIAHSRLGEHLFGVVRVVQLVMGVTRADADLPSLSR